MNLNIVLSYFPGLNAEGKFFLVYLLITHDKNREIVWNYKCLSEQHGVSDHVVRAALKYLTYNNYLTECPRPKRSEKSSKWFMFSEKFHSDFLNKISRSDCMHSDLIQDLLSCKDKNKYKGLRVSNRLLLITLLAHSEQLGIVKGLSHNQLKKLTGMTDDRLKSQLAKLSQLGYINYVVPGISSSHLFGVCKGYYSLNLSLHEYSNVSPKCRLIVISTLIVTTNKNYYDSNVKWIAEFVVDNLRVAYDVN
ncbi:hypothetical protein, partial [Psychromonas antarctica]|uniref:hypothetical protein n=1 Tax=Psychromonas antarctica TaxID=67573 RepID=UPI001EE8DA39